MNWIRIFDGGAATGQIGLIDAEETLNYHAAHPEKNGSVVLFSRIYKLPNAEAYRKAIRFGTLEIRFRKFFDAPLRDSHYTIISKSQFRDTPGTSGTFFPAYITAKEVREDSELWVRNGIISSKIQSIKEVLKTEFYATDNVFIDLPTCFYSKSGALNSSTRASAMIPDLANLASIGSHVIAPKPFGPRIDQRDPLGKKLGADIIAEKAMQKLAGGGLTVHLVDDWDTYHRGFGETHCGTNEQRTPGAVQKSWWEHIDEEDWK